MYNLTLSNLVAYLGIIQAHIHREICANNNIGTYGTYIILVFSASTFLRLTSPSTKNLPDLCIVGYLTLDKTNLKHTPVSYKRVFTENHVWGRGAEAGPNASDDPSGHENKEVRGEEEHGPTHGLMSPIKILYRRGLTVAAKF